MTENEIQDNKLYFRSDLEAYLKDQGLPSTRPTIVRYEKLGIIPSPRSHIATMKKGKKGWRVYYGSEIKEIAEILKSKMKGKKRLLVK